MATGLVYRPGVIVRIVLVFGLVTALAGCSGGNGGRRTVVAAFYPLAYAADQIGGPSFDIHNLTPPGAEPHDLELTPREVARIQQAGVVLYLSHGFQPAVSKAVADARGIRVDVLAGLPLHGQRSARVARPRPLRARSAGGSDTALHRLYPAATSAPICNSSTATTAQVYATASGTRS